MLNYYGYDCGWKVYLQEITTTTTLIWFASKTRAYIAHNQHVLLTAILCKQHTATCKGNNVCTLELLLHQHHGENVNNIVVTNIRDKIPIDPRTEIDLRLLGIDNFGRHHRVQWTWSLPGPTMAWAIASYKQFVKCHWGANTTPSQFIYSIESPYEMCCDYWVNTKNYPQHINEISIEWQIHKPQTKIRYCGFKDRLRFITSSYLTWRCVSNVCKFMLTVHNLQLSTTWRPLRQSFQKRMAYLDDLIKAHSRHSLTWQLNNTHYIWGNNAEEHCLIPPFQRP